MLKAKVGDMEAFKHVTALTDRGRREVNAGRDAAGRLNWKETEVDDFCKTI